MGHCRESHGIVETILLGQASLLFAMLPCWTFLEIARLYPDKQHEAEAKPDVAKVAEDVVECFEDPPGPGTTKVEVTGFRVALNREEDQLEGGDAVEDNEERNDVVVSIRTEVTVKRVAEKMSQQFRQYLSAPPPQTVTSVCINSRVNLIQIVS